VCIVRFVVLFETEMSMSIRPTPPLSREGQAEIAAELNAPAVDSPERRATFARAHAAAFLVRQVLDQIGSSVVLRKP
jgi:hypothetical protein